MSTLPEISHQDQEEKRVPLSDPGKELKEAIKKILEQNRQLQKQLKSIKELNHNLVTRIKSLARLNSNFNPFFLPPTDNDRRIDELIFTEQFEPDHIESVASSPPPRADKRSNDIKVLDYGSAANTAVYDSLFRDYGSTAKTVVYDSLFGDKDDTPPSSPDSAPAGLYSHDELFHDIVFNGGREFPPPLCNSDRDTETPDQIVHEEKSTL